MRNLSAVSRHATNMMHNSAAQPFLSLYQMVSAQARLADWHGGRGGTFTINATAANGAVITGKVNCSGFTVPIAEGGD